jgi:hypothetical protein
MVPIYKHVTYKAHYEDRCVGDHGKAAAAWPEGCLLDPKRVPWSGPNGCAGDVDHEASNVPVERISRRMLRRMMCWCLRCGCRVGWTRIRVSCCRGVGMGGGICASCLTGYAGR